MISNLARVSVFCFFASYALALGLELMRFVRRSGVLQWGTLGLTTAGLVAHSAYLVVRSRAHDLPPLLGSAHDWLLVSAWLAAVLYLGIQIFNRDLALGIFALPTVLMLIGASLYASSSPMPQVSELRGWGMVHASLLVFGIVGILLALVVSLMYLAQHARLKSKRSELPGLHLLSLEQLGRINWWLVILSVPLLTLGMVTGIWLSVLSRDSSAPVGLSNLAFAANAAIWVAMALLFGWILFAKHPAGRLVAWRTVLASLLMLLILLALQLLSADSIHGGGAA